MDEQQIDYTQAEALGISREAYDEVLGIVGRIPTIEELSTLLAMWQSNGTRQSLYAWLRGQYHAVELNDYLYNGSADHRAIREPKVKECLAIAHDLCRKSSSIVSHPTFSQLCRQDAGAPLTGMLLYMVGNVSSEFASGEYAQYLHISTEPMATDGHEEDCQYIEMILSAMQESGLSLDQCPVSAGGLFCSLLGWTAPLGFDILAPREVRLDAFLFGEEPGRYLTVTDEQHDDAFLLKLDEARLNCCFLGRTTKNRIMVDGFDFGPVSQYVKPSK